MLTNVAYQFASRSVLVRSLLTCLSDMIRRTHFKVVVSGELQEKFPTPPSGAIEAIISVKQHKMAPYDSDDSLDDEDQEYTETNVLLGYASKDADEDTISRIGGRPVSQQPPRYTRCEQHRRS